MGHASGSIGGTSSAGLARLAVLPNRRLPHVASAIGDSRIAAIYIDSARRNKAATSPINWANALLGQRLVIGETFGVSGERTDQVLARLPQAISSGAGLLYIQAGINDIAQNYPSSTTSGATACANIRTIANAARAAGMTVVIEAEVGGNGLSAVQVGQVNELNALLYEYAERTPGVHVHDARTVMLQPTYSDTALQFRANYAYDGTHANARGAMAWGESLAGLLGAIVPQRFGLLTGGRTELPGNGRRQLAANPLFVATAGGVLAGGATGTVPAGWTGYRSNTGMTAAYSTASDALDVASHVMIDVGFAASGDNARLYQEIATANWQPGDVLEGFARVALLGTPTGLGALYLQLTHNSGAGGAGYDNMDMYQPIAAGYVGPDRAIELTLRTRPWTLLPTVGTGAYVQLSVRAYANAAGTCQIAVRQCGVRRRDGA